MLLQLLSKYVASRENLHCLLDIALHFEVSAIKGNSEKQLEALLRQLELIIERHADMIVRQLLVALLPNVCVHLLQLHEKVARVYAHLQDSQSALVSRVQSSLRTTIDKYLHQFRLQTQRYLDDPGALPVLSLI